MQWNEMERSPQYFALNYCFITVQDFFLFHLKIVFMWIKKKFILINKISGPDERSSILSE